MTGSNISGCRPLQPDVTLCSSGQSRRVVAVVLQDTMAHERLMLLRVGGPHPQTVIFQPVNTSHWMATFTVCMRGWYTLHVLSLLTDGLGADLDPIAPAARSCSAAAAAARRRPATLAEYLAWHEPGVPPALLHRCARGLWSWHNTTSGNDAAWRAFSQVSVLQHPPVPRRRGRFAPATQSVSAHRLATSGGGGLSAASAALQRAVEDLHWGRSPSAEAAAGELAAATETGAPAMPYLQHRVLCLVGDSHTRNLANAVILLLEPRRACDPGAAQEHRSVCNSSLVHFRFLQFPLLQEVRDAWQWVSATRCDDVVVNSGLWPISSNVLLPQYRASSGGKPWTRERYSADIDALLAYFAARAAARQRVVWLSTTPTPVQEEHTRCPTQGWGFPNIIQQFNAVAAAAAARHGVPYVDAFKPTLALMDLSFDGLHFQAPIAREVALELLGRLFRTPPPHATAAAATLGRTMQGRREAWAHSAAHTRKGSVVYVV